jgi:hypothetical protein
LDKKDPNAKFQVPNPKTKNTPIWNKRLGTYKISSKHYAIT